MNIPVVEFINKFDLHPAVILLLLIIPILPNLWAIWHAYRRNFPSLVEKIAWVMVGIFFPVLGGLVYLFVGRKRSSPYPVVPLENNSETQPKAGNV